MAQSVNWYVGGETFMKHILVVDDEHGIRLLIQEILKADTLTIHTAETGKQAIDMILELPIELLIIDYKLPIMDGIEVLHILKDKKINLPTIFMTGLIESIEGEVEQFDFVKAVISKPFDVKELYTTVLSIMKLPCPK